MQTNIHNIKQSLLETIADWLNSTEIKTEIALAEIEISEKDNEEIHIGMADAAINVFLAKYQKNEQTRSVKSAT